VPPTGFRSRVPGDVRRVGTGRRRDPGDAPRITASFVTSAHDGATAALDALRDAPVTSTVVLLKA
jgi:hypothetical protein